MEVIHEHFKDGGHSIDKVHKDLTCIKKKKIKTINGYRNIKANAVVWYTTFFHITLTPFYKPDTCKSRGGVLLSVNFPSCFEHKSANLFDFLFELPIRVFSLFLVFTSILKLCLNISLKFHISVFHFYFEVCTSIFFKVNKIYD